MTAPATNREKRTALIHGWAWGDEHSFGGQILANQGTLSEAFGRTEAAASDNEFANNALANISSGEDNEEHCE